MKGWISLLGGLVIGFMISYFFLDYEGWTIYHMGPEGEVTKTINELDINLITNSFLIIAGVSILIYLILILVDKKSKEV